MKMKAYLDTNIESGRVRGDIKPIEEGEALRQLIAAWQAGELDCVTSKETDREHEKTRDPAIRARLQEARGETPRVPNDHALLGFNTVFDQLGGFVTSPLLTDIVDETLFADLKSLGLKSADARHLMYAVANGCDRFVTMDPDFINRRADLEARCPGVCIQKPTETIKEVRAVRKIRWHWLELHRRRARTQNAQPPRRERAERGIWTQKRAKAGLTEPGSNSPEETGNGAAPLLARPGR